MSAVGSECQTGDGVCVPVQESAGRSLLTACLFGLGNVGVVETVPDSNLSCGIASGKGGLGWVESKADESFIGDELCESVSE